MSEIGGINNEVMSLPQKISGKLRHLREDFKDEIPEEIVHSNSGKPNDIKAQRSWFTLAVVYLKLGLNQKEIADPKIKKKINAFIKYYSSENFHSKKLTTRRNIERANYIIDLYLENCKSNKTKLD